MEMKMTYAGKVPSGVVARAANVSPQTLQNALNGRTPVMTLEAPEGANRLWGFREALRFSLAASVVKFRMPLGRGLALADEYLEYDGATRWTGEPTQPWAFATRKPGELFAEGRTLMVGFSADAWHCVNAPADMFDLASLRKAFGREVETGDATLVVEADAIVRRVASAFELFGE
jgi:hypothetical protein